MEAKRPIGKKALTQREGFEVVIQQSIGTVVPARNGDHSPYEAAMLLIAKHGEEGRYEFTSPDRGWVRVDVNYSDPPEYVPARP